MSIAARPSSACGVHEVSLGAGDSGAVGDLLCTKDLVLLSKARWERCGDCCTVRTSSPRNCALRPLQGLGTEAQVVSGAFVQFTDLLPRGKVSETALRAYLLTTIRHEAGRRAKARQRLVP